MKPKILVRTDGGPQIGLGHLVRCSALAHMLKDDFQISFICKEIPDAMISELQGNGFNYSLIGDEHEFINKLGRDIIVVLDGYNFDIDYQKQIKSIGCKLVCIDDMHDKEFVADLIINYAPGIKQSDYKAEPYTQFALGLEYSLLRPTFLEQAKKLHAIEKVESLMICFGGSDYKNLTQATLSTALEFINFKKIIVVTGPSYNTTDEFEQLIKSDQRIEHRHALNEMQMLDTMLEAELAIVPASGILFEVLAAGCKVISGMYVENQKLVYSYFKDSGLISDGKEFDSKSLRDAINLSFNINNFGSQIIDGCSKRRITQSFLRLDTKLRNVTPDDCQLLFEWVNDFDVRKNSLSSEAINWENHLRWFKDRLNNPSSLIFILENQTKPVGQIRFDLEEDYWKIDYSIDKNYRGLGMGNRIVELGMKQINGKIRAWVKLENIQSCQIFEKQGFIKKNSKNAKVVQYYLI